MSIVFRSGLLAAVATVQTYFDEHGVKARVDVGWKKRSRQDNQSAGGAGRVVFIPSTAGGAGGSIIPARFPGNRSIRDELGRVVATVRPLATWNRQVTVSVWAVDLKQKDDEPAQVEAVETLLQATMNAVHGAPGAFASVTWGDITWTPPQERTFGLEASLALTFQHPIFDEPRELVYPSAASVSRADR